VKLFVVDPHTIYRRGLAACLDLVEGVDGVSHAETVAEAWAHPDLPATDLVIMDHDVLGGHGFITALGRTTGTRVLVCTSECSRHAVLASMHAGAIGFVRKDTLTTERLTTAVLAAASGAGVVSPDLLGVLARSLAPNGAAPVTRAPARLSGREQKVLSLIADGHATREVAQVMSYSERTVKNVLHDVVTKLNARSRSQAVAFAVREGLI